MSCVVGGKFWGFEDGFRFLVHGLWWRVEFAGRPSVSGQFSDVECWVANLQIIGHEA